MHITRIILRPDQYPVKDRFPFNIELFNRTPEFVLDRPVTFFAGENGTGKSTLLEAVAERCGIHIWRGMDSPRFVKNRYARDLRKYLDVEWTAGPVPGGFFASEIFRRFAELLDEWALGDPSQLKYFGGQSLISQSHGQGHMAFFRNRFAVKGLYLLDEPENALSPSRQMELLHLLAEVSGRGDAQFIVCTHSPILLSLEGGRIFSFDDVPAKTVSFEETGHYRIYRDFFDGLKGSR